MGHGDLAGTDVGEFALFIMNATLEKLACGKIVPRDLFRGPFHTTTQCESGPFYDVRRLFQVLPLRSLLYSRLLLMQSHFSTSFALIVSQWWRRNHPFVSHIL